MKFYVIWSDGRKFGPADIATLNQWAQERRINRDTEVENAETGQKGRAGDVQGISFPAPTGDIGGGDPALKAGEQPLKQQSTGPVIPGQPQPYVAGQPQQQDFSQQRSAYQNPPQAGSPYPRGYSTHIDDGSDKLITQAWIMYVVGFACCCIATPFGLYSANRAKNMGNPNAKAPVIVGWVLVGLQSVAVLVYGIIIALSAASGGGFPTN